MAESAFLDTAVAVYLLAEDPAKAAQAEALLARRPCISTQVVNELISVCMRKLRLDRPATQACARSHNAVQRRPVARPAIGRLAHPRPFPVVLRRPGPCREKKPR